MPLVQLRSIDIKYSAPYFVSSRIISAACKTIEKSIPEEKLPQSIIKIYQNVKCTGFIQLLFNLFLIVLKLVSGITDMICCTNINIGQVDSEVDSLRLGGEYQLGLVGQRKTFEFVNLLALKRNV